VPGTVSLSPTSVAIDASNLTKTVSITRNNSSGTISWSPTTVSGLTFNLNGNTLSITGNGSTAISSQTITVSVSSSKNYTSASATFTVSATYWSWGDETASGAGDATWWSTLKSKVATMTTDELKACVGKTKSVTLSTAVLGTTTHLVRCIGYNLDRDVNNTSKNTLTFQTANALATTTVFGSSNAYWASSTAKTQCANYYTYFPGKD
jgi:hypothetical protein